MRTRYAPPPIDQALLLAELKDIFPSHLHTADSGKLLVDLVTAYAQWWMLMLTYPERRIVGTAPLWYVRRLHANANLERFFSDCFSYLGKLVTKEDVWRGAMDFRGTHETARALAETFHHPNIAWEPILRTAQNQKKDHIVHIA